MAATIRYNTARRHDGTTYRTRHCVCANPACRVEMPNFYFYGYLGPTECELCHRRRAADRKLAVSQHAATR